MPRRRTFLLALTALTAGVLTGPTAANAAAAGPPLEKQPLAIGTGGAVARSTPTRRGSASTCWPPAATRSTPRSPRPPRSA